MSDKRNLIITQVGLGLSLFTCALVALGYFLLQRLGDSTEAPPVVVSTSQAHETHHAPGAEPTGPNVRPEFQPSPSADPSHVPYPQTTLRPIWLAPEQDSDDPRLPRFDTATPEGDIGQRSLFDSQPETHSAKRY
jgi:hypothetical protein